MWQKISIAAALAAAIVATVVSMQPGEFRIERRAVVDAAPAEVFLRVNDLHEWENWSPWAKIDPQMTTVYSGPESGQGASYAWAGNDDVGKGSMTITESLPEESVVIRLEFIEPFATTNRTQFTFAPREAGTEVAWIMTGVNGFAAKAAGFLVDMDATIGAQFETGLDRLRTIVETAAEDADPDRD